MRKQNKQVYVCVLFSSPLCSWYYTSWSISGYIRILVNKNWKTVSGWNIFSELICVITLVLHIWTIKHFLWTHVNCTMWTREKRNETFEWLKHLKSQIRPRHKHTNQGNIIIHAQPGYDFLGVFGTFKMLFSTEVTHVHQRRNGRHAPGRPLTKARERLSGIPLFVKHTYNVKSCMTKNQLINKR